MNSQAKTLLVTAFSPGPPTGGRVLLSRVVSRALHDICGLHLSVLELEPRPLRGLDAVLGVATGYVDGLTQRVVTATVRIVEESGVEKVFIDGSNLGVLVKALKRTRPTLEVTTLFHNCEARFFLGSLRQNRSLRSIGVLLANYRAERLAVKFSDKLLCLNLRDSALLSRLYGRSATHIMPRARCSW